MRIHGQVAPLEWTRVLEKIAGHPMILAGPGHVFYQLAPVAAMNLSAPFAG